MKNLLKILSLVLLLGVLLSLLVPAVTAAEVNLVIGDSITANSPIPFQYTDVYGHDYSLTFTKKPTYFLGGKAAYCIQPSTAVMDGMRYEQNDDESAWRKLSFDQKEAIGLILAYGYPTRSYAQTTDPKADAQTTAASALNGSWRNTEGHLATQLLIWEIVMGYRSASAPYSLSKQSLASYFDAGWTTLHATYNGILSCLKNHRVIPSFTSSRAAAAPTYELTYRASTGRYEYIRPDGSLGLTDSNKVSHLFNFTSNIDGLRFNGSSGSTLYIAIPADKVDQLKNGVTLSCYNNFAKVDPDKVAVFSDTETPNGAYQALIQAGEIGVDPIPAYFKLKATALSLSLKIIKTSDDGAISGITFNVYTSDPAASSASPFKTVTTGTDGTIQIDELTPADYWIEEVIGAEYHQQQIQKVSVTADNTAENPATVTFSNHRKTFQIEVIKAAADQKTPIAGAVYEIRHGTSVMDTLTTGADGKAVSASFHVCPASCTEAWTVQEISAPAGWQLDPTVYPIDASTATLTQKPLVVLSVTDQPITGTAKTTKVDAEFPENKLSGAIFEVYSDVDGNKDFDAATDTLIGEMTEAEPGVYTTTDLLYGGYFLYEKEAPKGYLRDTEYHYFEILEHGKTVEVENKAGVGFADQPIKGNVKLVKVDADNKETLLTGAVFEIYADTNGNGTYDSGIDTLIGELQDNGDGTYTTTDLLYGSYFIHEAVAPTGYVPDPEYYPITVQESKLISISNDPSGIFVNNKITGKLEITKVDAVTDELLPGAVFEITDAKGNVVAEGTTDERGVAVFDELPFGSYFYTEKIAPDGYILDKTPIPFDITEDGQVIAAKLKNEPIQVPPTGDAVNIYLYIGILIAAFMGIALIYLLQRRRKVARK